uniref:DbpA RNA binding domain-containing protein n=1 Tax=uncultured Agrobacterium sp. TaxID=157277 RepID=UPI0025FDF018
SGRTGRAGQKGVSAIVVPVNQRRKAERLLEGAKISPAWVHPPSADEIVERDGARLLADPSLNEPVTDDERDFVTKLLEQHGAEKVAAAFVRMYHSGRSAPEDISEVALDGRKPRRDSFETVENNAPRRDRSDFADSAWFTLSVGRKQNAEPRWLIPMLCRFGKLTRQDIGAIRMQQTETYVELAADAVDRFESALGKDMTLEKGIRVKAIEGKPEMTGKSREDTRPPKAQKKFAGKGDFGGERRGEDKPWKKKANAAGDRPGKFEGKKDKPFEKRGPKKKDHA